MGRKDYQSMHEPCLYGWKEGAAKGQTFYGLDFGYTAPTALVKIEYYEGSIYVQELIYQSKLTVTDLITKLKNLNLSRSDELFCDSAEPKTIEELSRAGFNAKPAEKDVWGGIMKVKSYPLFVTHESENVKRELQSYKWKTGFIVTGKHCSRRSTSKRERS